MNETVETPTVQTISTTQLHFDPENPRFYRLNSHASDEELIGDMLDEEGVSDLMMSIGQKGYFAGEPLLVTEEDGELVVVEGNRRLAAVKLLNREIEAPARRSTSVEKVISEITVAAPTDLPCIVYPTRKDVVRYLGYRHITGIKEWDSLSKAKYLANIRDEFYPDLSVSEQMQALAKDIGSRSDYVSKLLAALNLYINAENANFYGLPMTAKDVTFSFITTALGYNNIANWLGLESGTDIDAQGLVVENLKNLFAWMFAKDPQGRTILGESRKLNEIAAIVTNGDAIEVLMKTGNREEAYLYSDGPQEALEKALNDAISKAQMAWSMLLKIDSHTQTHLSLAEKLWGSARDIRNHLRDKLED